MSRAFSTNIDARLADLERRLAALEAARDPRDAADLEALESIARALDGAAATTAEIWRRAGADAALRRALRDADVDSPAELGYWLRRIRDVQTNGLRLMLMTRTGAGRQWAVHADGADDRHAPQPK